MEEKTYKTNILPVVPLRGRVAFPNCTLSFEVGREVTVKALERASLGGEKIVFICDGNLHTFKPKTLLLNIQKERQSILEKAMLVPGVLLGQITMGKKNKYSGWTAWVIFLAPCKGIN